MRLEEKTGGTSTANLGIAISVPEAPNWLKSPDMDQPKQHF
jgi:hypothetical protein